jgi:alpha-L-fucosidase
MWQYCLKQTPSVLDFPLIGALAELLLRNNPQIVKALQCAYTHIFLDEFQDTALIHYRLLKTAFPPGTLPVTAAGDQQQNIKLEGGQEIVWNVDPTTQWGNFYLCGPEFNRFDRSSTIEADLEHAPLRKGGEWREVDSDQMTLPIGIIRDYYLMQYIESPKAQDLLLDVASGNGIEVFVNGSSVMKHLNSYRCKHRAEKLLIHLNKGKNQVILRVYNRFEKEIPLMLRPA